MINCFTINSGLDLKGFFSQIPSGNAFPKYLLPVQKQCQTARVKNLAVAQPGAFARNIIKLNEFTDLNLIHITNN